MNTLNIFNILCTCTMLIPLMFLCIFPVRDYLRCRASALLLRSAACLVGFFLLSIPVSHLTILPTRFLLAMFAGVFFFYFYQQQLELPLNKSLFIFLTVYMISGFSRIFATLIDVSLHPDNTYQDISVEGFLFQLAFLTLADFVLYLPFTKYLGWLIAHFHSKVIWNYVCPFPFLCVIVTYILIPHNYSWMYIGRARFMYISVLTCLIILIVLLYMLFYQFVHTFTEKQNLEHHNEILSI